MSFTIYVDRTGDGSIQSIKCKLGIDSSVERISNLIRTGYLLDGGFLINSDQEIVLDIKPNESYYFVDFVRRRSEQSNSPQAQGKVASKDLTSITLPTGVTNSNGNGNQKTPGAKESDSKQAKRAKRPVDPNAPKKPLTAYLLYTADHQNEYKLKYPNLASKDLMTAIGQSWTSAPEDVKAVYVKRGLELREAYQKELELYHQSQNQDLFGSTTKAVEHTITSTSSGSIISAAFVTSATADASADQSEQVIFEHPVVSDDAGIKKKDKEKKKKRKAVEAAEVANDDEEGTF